MDYTINVSSSPRSIALERALDAYNASNSPMTAEAFMQKLIDGQLDGLVSAYLKTVITKLEFLGRFTADERVGIRSAAATNPSIADYLDLLNAAQDVMLTDARTDAGVQMLETAGLLAAGRAAQILAL